MAKIIGNTTATPMAIPDWNQTDEKKADYIKNKPVAMTFDEVDFVCFESIDGAGQEFYTLTPTALTFSCTPSISEFKGVQVDRENIGQSNYMLTEGSTILTLPVDYLKTLSVSNHELTAIFNNGTLSASFTVVEPEKNEYGFHYNQPYTAYVSALGDTEAFFIRDDGTLDIIDVSTMYTQTGTYTINGNILTVNCNLGTLTGTISSDGKEIYCNELATAFQIGSEAIAADEDYIYVYRNSLGGYEVTCIDKTKSSYGAIRTGINDKPTVALANSMFLYNSELVVAPVIPNGVTTIGNSAFNGCENLTNVNIPNGVTSIGKRAFESCKNLDIIIPDSVTSIGDSAFSWCYSLSSITIGDGVTTIGGNAFYACRSLTSITFGENSQLTTIGESAFQSCTSLTSVTIPDSVTSIGERAFDSCMNLTSINIPDGVTSIGDCAFNSCTSLTSVTIGENSQLASIGKWAFSCCDSLDSIAIPDGVTTIEEGAFYSCNNLTNITFQGTVEKWNTITFGNNWNGYVPATEVVCSNGTVAL